MEKLIDKITQSRIFQTRLFQSKTMRQFIKFGIIGLSNTVLSYILYIAFLKIFEWLDLFTQYDYLVSSILTFCICTTWSFYWNNRFTFKRESTEDISLIRAFIKTVISYSVTGLFLHNTMLYILVEYFGIPKEIVPLLILIVTVPLNFILNKYWAFKSNDD